MKPNDLLSLTLKSLRSNPLRSFLSSLGVFMGVFALSGTLQISDIGKTVLKKRLQEIQSPQILIFSYNTVTYELKKYQIEDLKFLKRTLFGWSYITPNESAGNGSIFYKNEKIDVRAQAASPDFLQASGSKLVLGNFFTVNDFQQNHPVIVIDELVSQSLFKGKNPLGKMIDFENKSYYIKGVVETKKLFENSENQGLILIPLSVYQALNSSSSFWRIIITPKSSEDLEKIQNQAVNLFKKRFKNEKIKIIATNNIKAISDLRQTLNTVTIILLLIGGMTLVVGGVGIANITIASIVERTSEIGLRRAIGATKKDILIQFLLEATIISMTGGIIAIITVQGITLITVNLFKFPYEFNYQTPLISLVSAVGIGLISSFLPAQKASKLDPVEALRS